MWYVLSDGKKFLGQHWAIDQNVLTKPRMAMLGSLAWVIQDSVTLCHGLEEVAWYTARAALILQVELTPVPVRFEGAGPLTKIVPIE